MTELYTEMYLHSLTSLRARKHKKSRLGGFRETRAMSVPNKGKIRKQKAIAEQKMIDAYAAYAPMFEDSMYDEWKQI